MLAASCKQGRKFLFEPFPSLAQGWSCHVRMPYCAAHPSQEILSHGASCQCSSLSNACFISPSTFSHCSGLSGKGLRMPNSCYSIATSSCCAVLLLLLQHTAISQIVLWLTAMLFPVLATCKQFEPPVPACSLRSLRWQAPGALLSLATRATLDHVPTILLFCLGMPEWKMSHISPACPVVNRQDLGLKSSGAIQGHGHWPLHPLGCQLKAMCLAFVPKLECDTCYACARSGLVGLF